MTFTSGNESYSMCSRRDFSDLYEYLKEGGLEFEFVSYAPNVTDALRDQFEEEARLYYRDTRPDVVYHGFTGSIYNPKTERMVGIGNRTRQPFYFPQHMIQPTNRNEFMIGYDLYSSNYYYLIDRAIQEWKPVISNPIPSIASKFILFIHPGVPLSSSNETTPTGLGIVAVGFASLIRRATATVNEPVRIFVFDISSAHAEVLYGGYLRSSNDGNISEAFINSKTIKELRQESKAKYMIETDFKVEHQTWKVMVIDEKIAPGTEMIFITLSGTLIYFACFCVSLWFYSATKKAVHIADLKRKSDEEKACLIVANAERTAKRERNLNEYLAHEVRNPLSAAMSACNFLSFAHNGLTQRIPDYDAADDTIQEDIDIINNSLRFIYDLLRSTLDVHKASDRQMHLVPAPTDILHDILEPVKTILHRHSNNFHFYVDCPKGVVVMADRMRLKQIILNLASNAKKFVQHGFIRIGACITENGSVRLYVEDSGPGIPHDKRSKLFSKFQASLDSLNQGTGVGLSLCKTLVELMGGSIHLDDKFISGIEGSPGTRFIIDLNCVPIEAEQVEFDYCTIAQSSQEDRVHDGGKNTTSSQDVGLIGAMSSEELHRHNTDAQRKLPDQLSVLVVDDDMILRKLLARSLKRVAPNWTIQEAANGETALKLVEEANFDIIFLDQYMASIEKQLLGTETAQALRSMGVTSTICGLSANNLKDAFFELRG